MARVASFRLARFALRSNDGVHLRLWQVRNGPVGHTTISDGEVRLKEGYGDVMAFFIYSLGVDRFSGDYRTSATYAHVQCDRSTEKSISTREGGVWTNSCLVSSIRYFVSSSSSFWRLESNCGHAIMSNSKRLREHHRRCLCRCT